jgi:alginate O-acetyltransferase complex protein AlgJ
MLSSSGKDGNVFSYNSIIYIILFVWLLIPASDIVAKYFLGVNFFAFRAWEVVVKGADSQGSFKSSFKFEKMIYGDLANKLNIRKFRQYRYQLFTTDGYGFRNKNRPSDTYYPIVVVGDSDMAGSSLSDNMTFSSQLEKELDIPVYNYACLSPLDLLKDKRFMKDKPQIVIWEQIERSINGGTYEKYANLMTAPDIQVIPKQVPKETQLPLLSKHIAQNILSEVQWYFLGMKNDDIHYIDRESEMLFFKLGIPLLNYDYTKRGYETVVKGVKQIQKHFNDKGIKLIYLPLPDKENIYSYMLPLNMKSKNNEVAIRKLYSRLLEEGISTIDLYSLFTGGSTNDKFLYFKDDTHWNSYGVAIAAKATTKYITKNDMLLRKSINQL